MLSKHQSIHCIQCDIEWILCCLIIAVLRTITHRILGTVLRLLCVYVIYCTCPDLIFIHSGADRHLCARCQISDVLLADLSFDSVFSCRKDTHKRLGLSCRRVCSLLFVDLLYNSGNCRSYCRLFQALLCTVYFQLFYFIIVLFLLDLHLKFLDLCRIGQLFAGRCTLLLRCKCRDL